VSADRWLDAINNIDLLNAIVNADPGLRDNMKEMGFIRLVPFQMDHNNQVVAKWMLTEAGRQEVLQRYITRSNPVVN
jgi:hypothetical protein